MMIRQMVICAVDHTDGNLHNDQHTLIFKFYIWEHLKLKLKLKLSNMYAYVNLLHYTPPFLLGLTIDWKIEDSDSS